MFPDRKEILIMFMPSIFRNHFMDDFFDDDIRFPFSMPREQAVMKTDVKEEDDHYELTMELPGYNKEDIKAEIQDGYLVISAEINQNKDEKDDKGNYIRRERYFGRSQRRFAVGSEIKPEDIQASFKDGILQVDIPKKEEKPALPEQKLITIQ